LIAANIYTVGKLDLRAYQGFTGLNSSFGTLSDRLSGSVNPTPFVFIALAILAIAMLRRRYMAAAVVACAIGGANLTTQLLKSALSDPRAGAPLWPNDSWPSGHTTAVMSLALALVIVLPARFRPIAAALGGLYTLCVGYALVVEGWHLPSDVLGGLFIAAAWAFLGVAVLAIWDRRTAAATRELGSDDAQNRKKEILQSFVPSLVAIATVVTVAVIVAFLGLNQTPDYSAAHSILITGTIIIAIAAFTLTSSLVATLRLAAPTET
jgi:membrane-associated phospholipid phosphatase